MASSSLSAPAVGEVSSDENQTANGVAIQLSSSYRDRFPLLPYLGPLVIRDPIESCADLDEVWSPSPFSLNPRQAMRVGSYGRQLIKADTQTRGTDGALLSGRSNGHVLKLSRKAAVAPEDQVAGKRGLDPAVTATVGSASKRPKLVKFVMN